MKNLGVQICDIEPELLEEEILKKGRKLQPISKKRKIGEDGKETSRPEDEAQDKADEPEEEDAEGTGSESAGHS